MALTVGELVGVLDIDDSEYNRKLDRGEKRFGSAGAAIGRAVKGVVTVAGTALVAAGGIGLSTASQMEQAEIGFTTMLGSGVKAKAFLGELSAFAAKTPFEFPELQKAASSLVSVGVKADRVIPIMTVLGDATAAMGTGSEGIQRATMALQQMAIKGKVSGEEMLQLAEAGVPAWDALAASLGVTGAEAQKLVSEGKVSVDQLYTAIETRSGTSLKRVSGMMSAQSTSLKGMWSTFKDTFSVGMANAILPLVPLIKDGLGGATNFVAKAMPKLASGIAAVVAAGKLLVTGDFTDRIFGQEEDSKTVAALLKIREGFKSVLAAGKLIVTGDFTGRIFGQEEDSETVAALFKVREAIGGVVDRIKNVDREKLKQALSSAYDAARELLPVIREFIAELPDLSDTLGVAATVLGFLADHADLLAKALPFLAAAFLVVKIAQAAGNAAALASIPIQAAQVASNFALARALRATATASTSSAAQQVAASGAIQASSMRTAMASAAAAARVVAGWAVMGVQALLHAAKVAAAWLIALGPIGIVIAVVVALAVLIVKNWDLIKRKTADLAKAIGGAIANATRWVATHFMAMVRFVATVPGRIARFLLGMFVALGTAWINANTYVVNAFVRFAGWVAGWPAAIGRRVIGTFSALGSSFGNAWGAVSGGWSRFAGWVAGWPAAIRNRLSDMFGAIPAAFRSAVNAVIRGWNNLEFSIPGFDPPGPLGPFGGITIGTPNLPYLARGGLVRRGGRAVVGEDGAEVVDLPTGSRVTPGDQFAGRQPVLIELRSGGSRMDDLLVEILSKAIRDRGGNVQLVLGGGRAR